VKSCQIENKIVEPHVYETFKTNLGQMGVKMTIKKERRYGTNAVELIGCELTFEPSSFWMERKERASFDVEAHWNRVLTVCRGLGFQAK
jgi:hypothetical protein